MSHLDEFEAAFSAELARLNRPKVSHPATLIENPKRGIKYTFWGYKHYPEHPYPFTHLEPTLSELQAKIEAYKAAKREGFTITEVLKIERFT